MSDEPSAKRGRRKAEAEHAWEWLDAAAADYLASVLGESAKPMQRCSRCATVRKGNRLLLPSGPRFANVFAALAGCRGEIGQFDPDLMPNVDRLSYWPIQNIDEEIRRVRAAITVGAWTNPAPAEEYLRLLWVAARVIGSDQPTTSANRPRTLHPDGAR